MRSWKVGGVCGHWFGGVDSRKLLEPNGPRWNSAENLPLTRSMSHFMVVPFTVRSQVMPRSIAPRPVLFQEFQEKKCLRPRLST